MYECMSLFQSLITEQPAAKQSAPIHPAAVCPEPMQPPDMSKQPVANHDQCEDGEYEVETILDEKEPLPEETTEEKSSKWKIVS